MSELEAPTCTQPGCEKRPKARGLCNQHYLQLQKAHGAGGKLKTDQAIVTKGLMALVMWAGNSYQAAKMLREDPEDRSFSRLDPETLKGWMMRNGEEYQRLRDEYAPQLEQHLAHELRGGAARAVHATLLAVDAAEKRIVEGRDLQPSQTAKNLAAVGTTFVDRLLALTGRPSQIIEKRSADEIARNLAAKGILEIVEGDAEDDEAA